MNFSDSIQEILGNPGIHMIQVIPFWYELWTFHYNMANGKPSSAKKENICIYIKELVNFIIKAWESCMFLIVHPIEKSHSSMFTPSTFPTSPTLPSYSFKAPLWALVSRILGAVHPKSRPRAMWAWHSLVEKRNVFGAMWSESMPMTLWAKQWRIFLLSSCWAGFYFTLITSVPLKRTINQWIAASRWSPPRTMPSPCRPVPPTLRLLMEKQWSTSWSIF